jgi:hypothetical protein
MKTIILTEEQIRQLDRLAYLHKHLVHADGDGLTEEEGEEFDSLQEILSKVLPF